MALKMKKQLNILKQGRIPTNSEVEVFEAKIGTLLPESYRNFLLRLNPIHLKECNYRNAGKIYEIHNFIPFKSGEWSLEQHFENLKEHFENRFIAFAGDSGGWQYILSIEKNENYGKIYFCRMDEEIENAITVIADSFEEFINGFYIENNF